MISPAWEWAGAKATGTSHIRAGKGCDDFGGCLIVRCPDSEVLVVAVSDGAGSAEHSAIGSRLATMRFMRCASEFLKSGGNVASLTQQTTLDWLDDIRDCVSGVAAKLERSPRDFAATLVACIAAPDHAAFIHVGDGAAVFRFTESSAWQIGSWPAQGEYASTTYFVTDEPEPRIALSHVEGPIGEVSVFTDGIERLVLEFSSQTAFAPFFERVFGALTGKGHSRDRDISKQLSTLLESRSVCEKTDDDKTLILAKRVR
jgi:hypothetical protein